MVDDQPPGFLKVVSTYSWIVVEFSRENPLLSVACIVVALTLAPIQEVVLPHLYGKMINVISGKNPGGAWFAPTIVTIAVLAGTQVLWLARELLNAHLQPRIDSLVRQHLMSIQPETGSADTHAGKFMSGLVRTPAIITYWANVVFAYLIPYIATIAGIVIYLARRDAMLAVALVATTFGITVLLSLAPRTCTDVVRVREASLRSVHEAADDSVVNRVAMASLDAEGLLAESDRRQAGEHAYRRAHLSAVMCVLRVKSVAIPMLSVYVAFVVWRGLSLVISRRMDVGSFVAVFMMTTGLLGTLTWITSLMHDTVIDLGTLSASIDKGQRRKVGPTGADADPSGHPPKDGAGLWQVTAQVLDRVSLHFPDGKLSYLKGPVGSGKSTVLRILAGIVVPESGTAYAAGAWAAPGPLGYMPQQPTLLDRSVIENIALGRVVTPALREAIWVVAEHTGLAGLLMKLPNGLDSPAGKNGSRLSGGQRQVVWLARIAVRAAGLLGPRPQYLLLDEPTAAMDDQTARVAIEAVQKLVDDGMVRAAVVITHR